MDNVIIVLICMIFCHIVDDYYLQGILAKMKQKGWWEENAPDKLYKYDYIVALIMHSISWSFMILLPLLLFRFIGVDFVGEGYLFTALFIINTIIHALVDHLKANKHTINLITDQSIHIGQIIVTWAIMVFW